MTAATDDQLYEHGAATLVASWEEYARGSAGASLLRLDGAAVAAFPEGPERDVYNNALVERGLDAARRDDVIEAVRGAYESRGIDSYAVWVHEGNEGIRAALTGRGYVVTESTRAMGISLGDLRMSPGEIPVVEPEWPGYLKYLEDVGAPAGLLSGADQSTFHVLAVRSAGKAIATALAFDLDGDCGIYNMSTLERARRQGIGTAILSRHLHDAVERGCSTATLQATPVAEGLYASAGFRDLGRFIEYGPRP